MKLLFSHWLSKIVNSSGTLKCNVIFTGHNYWRGWVKISLKGVIYYRDWIFWNGEIIFFVQLSSSSRNLIGTHLFWLDQSPIFLLLPCAKSWKKGDTIVHARLKKSHFDLCFFREIDKIVWWYRVIQRKVFFFKKVLNQTNNFTKKVTFRSWVIVVSYANWL